MVGGSRTVQCCFISTETIGTIRDGRGVGGGGGSRTVQCCFISTETIRTIRDGEDLGRPSQYFHTAPDL